MDNKNYKVKVNIGDIAIIDNSRRGLEECPILYVSDHFIIVKSKFYNMTVNILANGKFNSYINEMNKFVRIKNTKGVKVHG